MKVKMQTNLIVKLYSFLFLFLMLCGNVQGQTFTMTGQGSGVYDYDSPYPSNYLTFYLLGDGHYTFSGDPTHQYNNIDLGTKANVFYVEPYDDNESVDEYVFSNITDGVNANVVPIYQLSNQIDLTRSWNPMQDENNYFILRFENNTNAPMVSGCVEFHYSTADMTVHAGDVLDEYPNGWVDYESLKSSEYSSEGYDKKHVWSFDNLMPGEQRLIYIWSKCGLPPASQMNTRAVMKVDDCEKFYTSEDRQDGNENGVNNSEIYTLTSVISTFAHDPNCIVTNPTYLCLEDIEQTVRYRFYFQNDAVDPVGEAEVAFYLDYPVESINLVEASHDCNLEWFPTVAPGFSLPKGKVIFPNIILPGTLMTPTPPTEETVGWVDLDICFDLDYMTPLNMDCINSKIDIRFDLQTDVPAFNEICRTHSCNGLNIPSCDSNIETIQTFEVIENSSSLRNSIKDSTQDLEISPNPVYSHVILSWQNAFEKIESEISILDVNGSILQEIHVQADVINMTLNVSELSNGIYFIKLRQGRNSQIKRFVKI